MLNTFDIMDKKIMNFIVLVRGKNTPNQNKFTYLNKKTNKKI